MQSSILIETLEEIHETTRDEYGLKARGFLHSLESFSTLLGLQLSHKLFSVAEQVSLVLQKKSLTIQDSLSAVDTAKAYYSCIRTDDEFNHFYEGAVKDSENYAIGKPELPRYRRRPSKLDDGPPTHQYPSAKAYFRHIYLEACELMSAELEQRFHCQHIPSVIALEKTMLNAANGSEFHNEITLLEDTCFKNDIQWDDLKRHLPLLPDIIKQFDPQIKRVTSVETICQAMASNSVYQTMLPSVHLLLRLYMTLPISSATSERTFSAMKHLMTYLRSTMREKRLNHCLLLHVHKSLTDGLDLISAAKEFISHYDERLKYYGNFVSQ